jgi:hypothetical protein
MDVSMLRAPLLFSDTPVGQVAKVKSEGLQKAQS